MLGFLKRASKAACFSAFLLSSWGKQLEARACRVNLIPYGGKFGCATCHNNVSGGGPRNPFGRDLERIVRQCNGFWNAAIAAMDSDGDGKVNVIDAMYTISFLVSQGSPPPAPFPACGAATGGKLQCDSFAACP